jgi:hypothetical protein
MVPSQRSYDLPYEHARDARSERAHAIRRGTSTDWQRAVGVLSNQLRTIVIFAAIVIAAVTAATLAMRPCTNQRANCRLIPLV